jgi:formylmethanofuran dehydrogenase subunit E
MNAVRSLAVRAASQSLEGASPWIVATDPEVIDALAATAARHDHLCPRQVLGVRIGFAAREALGFKPQSAKGRVLVLVETDGCFADGIEAATGCSMGHRTMRLEDYGRVAATFVDIDRGVAFRIAPAAGIRALAAALEPEEPRRYYAQLRGYQRMPATQLLTVTPVSLAFDVAKVLGRNGSRIDCSVCGEEVINQREVLVDGQPRCPACAGNAYYTKR